MVKKAQMKIQQMAFMLIAVTVFFVLVGMFVLVFKFSGLKETATNLEEENAMKLVSGLSNSPEFSCGKSYGNNRLNCIDMDKVLVLKSHISDYKDFWGVNNIEVRKIFPGSDEKECSLGNYPDCNFIRIKNQEVSGFDASTFVILCRKDGTPGNFYDKCELGKLMVSYETK